MRVITMLRKADFTRPVRNDYPTGDGKPMAETPDHGEAMWAAITVLHRWLADTPDAYAWGNMLMFYEPGNKRRHVSPDVFYVSGVPNHRRPNYLIWEEGRGPDVVIEVTSASTRRTDLGRKMDLYRDVIRVREYFLFDPLEEYLEPSLQGFRLTGGEYRPIRPKDGRLPSQALGLHLDRDGHLVRFWDPDTGSWLPTEEERANTAVFRAEAEREKAEAERARADAAVAEAAKLRAELERLKGSR
jgi:Uma2 family endonuclease